MEYLATFYTHYGAMRFHKQCRKDGTYAKMTPVPRDLSASCGIAVRFNASFPPQTEEHEDMERCYLVAPDGVYIPAEA